MQTLKFRNVFIGLDLSKSKYILQRFNPNKGTSSKETDSNIGRDGINILNAYYDERSLTAKGIIIASSPEELYDLRRALVNNCDGKTQDFLYLNVGDIQYKALALADVPDFGDIKGNSITFNINFTLPKFYWYGGSQNIAPLFKQENYLKTEFTLPLILTQRTGGAEITNSGDVPSPFTIEIHSDSLTTETGGVRITNTTTGEYLFLDYSVSKNEVVNIDTEEMTITSNINGNIIRYLDRGSNFFTLAVGKSRIIAVNNNADNHITTTLKFYDRYIGV